MRIDRVSRQQLHPTFAAAFADYATDASQMTATILETRAAKSNVDFDLSVGAFEGERMVGFTLIGIDQWQGELAAYDAGTGIIPAYRGQGLAQRMFDHALPPLRARGVTRFLLEVLQVNEAAIRAYQKAGFEITRELACFELEVTDLADDLTIDESITLRPADRAMVAAFSAEVDWQPSWENSFAAIQRLPDELLIFAAEVDGSDAGIIAYTPQLNWILTLVVRPAYRRRGIATALVRHLVRHLPAGVDRIKALNVETTAGAMLACLARLGFKHWIDQYEMARPI